jgi:hypothetical protein
MKHQTVILQEVQRAKHLDNQLSGNQMINLSKVEMTAEWLKPLIPEEVNTPDLSGVNESYDENVEEGFFDFETWYR